MRFCPQLFSLRDCPPQDKGLSDNEQQQPFQLPYRMVFAIATLDSIIMYDTQVRDISQSVCAPMGCHCAASGACCPPLCLQAFCASMAHTCLQMVLRASNCHLQMFPCKHRDSIRRTILCPGVCFCMRLMQAVSCIAGCAKSDMHISLFASHDRFDAHVQQSTPIAVLGSLHFEAVTDLAWSCDGAFLAISSYDGYCR